MSSPNKRPFLDDIRRFLFGDDLFISYSRRDADYALALANELTKKKLSCFLDQWGTRPGEELPEELKNTLRRSSMLVILGTKSATTSESVRLEVEEFLCTGRPITPVTFMESNPTVESQTGAPQGSPSHSLEGAAWYPSIKGIAPAYESTEALGASTPSGRLVTRITNGLGYRSRNKRLRVAFFATLAGTLVLISSAGVTAEILRRKTIAAEKKTEQAQHERLDAENRTQRAKDDLTETGRALNVAKQDLIKTRDELTNATQRAEIQRRTAEAFNLTTRSQGAFENNPLQGLRLALEAQRTAPKDNAEAVQTIDASIQAHMRSGRVLKFGGDKVNKVYVLQNSPVVVVAQREARGELRHGNTYELLETLSGNVVDVIPSLARSDKDQSSTGIPAFQDLRDSPYFVIKYENGEIEVRRLNTGACVSLSGRIKDITKRTSAYFVFEYEDHKELRCGDKGDQVILSDKFEYLRLFEGTHFFAVWMPDGRTELQRTDKRESTTLPGELLPPILYPDDYGRLVDKTALESVSFDRSLFKLIRFGSYATVDHVELRSADNGQPVSLPSGVKNIFFSPSSDYYIVAYKGRRGELRRTDSSKPVELSGEVDSVDFTRASDYFVVSYIDKPGELLSGRDPTQPVKLKYLLAYVNEVQSSSNRYLLLHYKNLDQDLYDLKSGKTLNLLPSSTSKWEIGPHPFNSHVLIEGLGIDLRTGEPRPQARYRPRVLRIDTGEPVVGADGDVAEVRFVSDSPYLIVKYLSNKKPEVFRIDNGKRFSINGYPAEGNFRFSPDKRFYVVSQELHRADNDNLVENLVTPGDLLNIEHMPAVDFSPDSKCFVIDHALQPDELRATSTGKLIRALNDGYQVTFSPNSIYFMNTRGPGLSEIRLTATGEEIAVVQNAWFSPSGSYFVCTYDNNTSELWDASDKQPYKVTSLGAGLVGHIFGLNEESLSVSHRDGRAYLIDIRWLKAMKGNPSRLRGSQLLKIACEPFKDLSKRHQGENSTAVPQPQVCQSQNRRMN